MDALAARKHREADEADVGKLAADIDGRLLDVGEIEPLIGIEVKDHAVGSFERVDMAAPAMKLDRPHLDAGEQTVGGIDIEIILVPAVLFADRDMVDMVAERARVMLLEDRKSTRLNSSH